MKREEKPDARTDADEIRGTALGVPWNMSHAS